jgi:hypothetical protein
MSLSCLLAGWSTGPVALGQDIQYRDVTQEAGVHFFHHSSPEKKYLVEVMAGGVTFFDYDKDGWLDLYLVDSLTVETAKKPQLAVSRLFRNKGDGTFLDVTETSGLKSPGWGMGVVAGDFDNDGWLDLYVTCLGPNRLYRNNGDGTFTEVGEKSGVADSRWSIGAAFGDFDNDEDLDLFVSNYVDFSLDNLPEFGEGKWCQHRGIPVHCGPRGLKGAGDSLFRNNGDGTFTDVSESAGVHDPEGRYGLGVLWSDLDDDGFADLFVVNDTGSNYLYLNQKDGSFEDWGVLSGLAVNESGLAQGCMGIALGDYDHDGKLDLHVTNFGDEYNVLYRKESAGTFMDRSFSSNMPRSTLRYVGWGTGFLDYNNDGWVDLFVANGHVYPQVDSGDFGYTYAQPKLLFLNNHDGTFKDVSVTTGEALRQKRASRGVAFGDYDNDGDIDIVVNDIDGPPMLLRNDGGNRQHWITVRAESPAKNRFAIGAQVRVAAGDLVQLSEIRSGGSYAAQNDLRQHFGLGSSKTVDWIEVRWADGSRSRIDKVEADQEITVTKSK